MMRGLAIAVALFGAALAAGCSDSTSSTPTYPLQLSIIYQGHKPGFDTLQFNVKRSGTPVAGADITYITYPAYQTVDLQVKTDAAGNTEKIPFMFSPVQVSKVAFQASKDSLQSGYVYYVPQ